MTRIREPAVAGSFYPADPGELKSTVDRLLGAVQAAGGPAPQALIVPHAGYVYSGPVAAAGYARLRPFGDRYRRVVLLGPAHYSAFPGLAASAVTAFRTPLGDVPLDTDAIDGMQHPLVTVMESAHGPEHSLEVQLPFLQSVLQSFRLVPLAVGDAHSAEVAEVIRDLWKAPDVLVVVSSDLSHYLRYEEARGLDRETCRAIEAMHGTGIDHARACGATAIRALLTIAGRRGLHAVTLDLRNSGDTAGGKGRVVGYGAWMFVPEEGCE